MLICCELHVHVHMQHLSFHKKVKTWINRVKIMKCMIQCINRLCYGIHVFQPWNKSWKLLHVTVPCGSVQLMFMVYIQYRSNVSWQSRLKTLTSIINFENQEINEVLRLEFPVSEVQSFKFQEAQRIFEESISLLLIWFSWYQLQTV